MIDVFWGPLWLLIGGYGHPLVEQLGNDSQLLPDLGVILFLERIHKGEELFQRLLGLVWGGSV